MNIKTVTPIENTLKAFQIEFDPSLIDEQVVWLNTYYGAVNTYHHTEDNGVHWISEINSDRVLSQVIVSGDWAVMNYGRVWFLSAYDFNKTYKDAE